LVRTPHDSPPLPDPPLAPVAAADADASVPNAPWHRELTSVLPFAVAGLGVAALGGLVFGVRRRRRLRPLPKQPESDVVVEGGFAEAELAHDLTRGIHGIGFDPVAALVGQFERFLDEFNLSGVHVLTVSHGRSSTTIELQCQLAEQAILVDLASEFARRLDAEVEPSVSVDQDVVLRLTGLRRTRLLPTADVSQRSPCLVPLGVLLDKQAFVAEWSSLGHVLVVSLPGHGADTILTSLVATLTARRSPEDLRVWVIGSRRALPAPLFEVPHLAEVIDPADEIALTAAVAALRTELEHRANRRVTRDLVVVVPELASLGEQADTLALLMSQSAELGVRFVVSTARPDDALTSSMRPQFNTRMVLRMQSEDASVALLGVSDAASLPGGGRLCLRIDGREAIELYGYQISPEHLERLVALMRSAYASPSTPPAPTQADEDAAPETRPIEPEPKPEPAPSEASTPESPVADVGATELQACAPPESDVRGVSGPPVQVFCLGEVRVLCAGQQVWPRAGGGDAKPWELLLFAASQPADGVARRTVEEALWPGDEQPEDATHRYRQLRYRLRKTLAAVPGGPPTDGICLDQYSLRLDPAVVSSDAHEFLTLARAARLSEPREAIEQLERARGLYAGDLMDGPGARRYAWVEERDNSGVTLREHYRRVFQQASQHLAGLYASVGALTESIRVYRELTEIDPTDEQHWRELFRLHAQRGDRAELIREEIRLHACLRELADDADLSAGVPVDEPSRETAEEFARLLASLRDAEPATA
jgi:DNA-binding SARP family transcriptional activator